MSDLISAINVIAQENYKEFAMAFLDMCPQDIQEKVAESRAKVVKRQWKLHLTVIILTGLSCFLFYAYGTEVRNTQRSDMLLFVSLSAVLVWTFWFVLLFIVDNIRGRNDAYNLFYKYAKEHQVHIVMEVRKGNEEKIFKEIRIILYSVENEEKK